MKKILILSVLSLAVSSALAAPTFSFNPSSVTADTATDIQIIYNQDNTDPGTTYALQIKPPAGVTIGTITPNIGFICQLNGAGNIAVGITSVSALPDGHSPCTFSATVPASLTSATFSIEQAQHVLESGTIIKTDDGSLNIPGDQPELSLTVGGAGGFSTTVNYSIGPGTGSGTFTCDSGPTGAAVAGGTTVSCTATPDATHTSTISGCPAGATTNTNTSCVFDASTTANETVDLSAVFMITPLPGQYTLSVMAGANGSVSCTPSAGSVVAAGDSVSCTATPDTGYNVGTWTAPAACSGTSCTFNMPAADTTVSATFIAGNNPTSGSARPVPALGVFGLLAMLASMFGAATMVLRRKR